MTLLGCMKPAQQLALLVCLASVAGVTCVLAPYVAVHGFGGTYSSPLFPLLRNAWEDLQPILTVILLLGVGITFGFLWPRYWLVLGASTMLLFPLAATLEMVVDPGSHNLWPVEFMLYGVFIGAPAVAGGVIGSVFAAVMKRAT